MSNPIPEPVDVIVPNSTRLAAKRGFVRTTAQAYAATLTTGISATIVLGLVTGTVEVVPTLVTVGIALVSPPLSGLVSYLSILSEGVPREYTAGAVKRALNAAAGRDPESGRQL